jgi:hypothetical protein
MRSGAPQSPILPLSRNRYSTNGIPLLYPLRRGLRPLPERAKLNRGKTAPSLHGVQSELGCPLRQFEYLMAIPVVFGYCQ